MFHVVLDCVYREKVTFALNVFCGGEQEKSLLNKDGNYLNNQSPSHKKTVFITKTNLLSVVEGNNRFC